MQITLVSRSIQPKHRPMLTFFSTSELCGTGGGNISTSFSSKGRSREFLGTFFGKKVPAIARHEGRQDCVGTALAIEFTFKKSEIQVK